MKPSDVARTVLIYKILGAASYAGKNIDEVCELAKHIMENMAASGVSVLVGASSGKPASSLEKQARKKKELDIGWGIKCKKERQVFEWRECKQLVAELLSNLKGHTNVEGRTSGKKSEWIAMINNCGFASSLEMTMIVNEFVKQF